MGFGEVNQLHTGSRGGDNYEKVNEETPVTKASMCIFKMHDFNYYIDIYKWIGYKIVQLIKQITSS